VKRKLLIISTLIATQLFAKTINFEMMDKNPIRIAPNTNNEILSFNNSVKNSVNSIVNISAKKHVDSDLESVPFQQMLNDPLFKKFFGDQFAENQFKQNRVQRSLGSGVVISKDGYIVTNNHVIENAEEITVTIGDDTTEYNGKLIGRDADSDMAVIKIETQKALTPIKIGDSNTLQVGDVIFAIGNPFGIGSTVTQGIISALNKNKVGINRYENYIQTDASINPGNSGGALVDSRGALIGINTAIISKSGGNNGIGFAIPIAMVQDVVTKLVADGKVIRGYLGVVIGDVDNEVAKVYKRKEGALILDISADTPAAKYGLKRGDLIYAINGKNVKDKTSLQNTIASFKPEEKVLLQVERDRKDIEINIVLSDRTSSLAEIQTDSSVPVLGGLKLSAIDAENQKKFRLPNEITGILISDVEPKSQAEKSGFQSGDVIIQIEDLEIKNFANIDVALKKYNDKYKRVYVNRYGQTILFVTQ
jgi:serine protease Do